MTRSVSWREREGLRAFDIALADTLRRLDGDADASGDAVLLGAALASLAIGEGHAAFDPSQPHVLLDDTAGLPDADAWRDALAHSRWVSACTPAQNDAASDSTRPLVLEDGRLYLRRYREYERRLAFGLRRLAAQSKPLDGIAGLAPVFAQLFPAAHDGDLQARAAALALARSLLLVTGGPGTGKTTTIARLLVLLHARARLRGATPPRIALAAPTGRAADRMAQSLRVAAMQLQASGIDPALCAALPDAASTVHRLLGAMGDGPRFRHDAGHPLPFDVVVVDEASMVDLPLMCKLVEAVPDGAQLILLGDRDQLPSVEAGDVLAAIVDAAGEADEVPRDTAAALQPLLGALPVHATTPPPGSLRGCRVQLQRGYRQHDTLDLAPLAQAVRAGDAATAWMQLQFHALRGVSLHEGLLDPLSAPTRDQLLAPWRALATTADPAQALALAGQQRLLTALRGGAQGAIALNARIEEALAGTQREAYFHGRLLLVTENSYRHGLFNGDIGVCLRGADGAPVAWFAGSDGPRGFHPASLPAHAGAFAMTVHKAQGSEFDGVWLLLPKQGARTLSRELVYTAITRARREVRVCGSGDVFANALSRHAQRVSGLTWRLRD